jgi:DNA mismatch endonuclease (patch repair protein)
VSRQVTKQGPKSRSLDRCKLAVDSETSARLGRIRQRDTGAEVATRRIVHSLGHRYRIRNRDLPGSPDLANRSKRWAIFVHGCFWHAHRGCLRATVPKRNREFWVEKFETNRKRDAGVLRALNRLGYVVAVVWECEIQRPDRLGRRLATRVFTRCP